MDITHDIKNIIQQPNTRYSMTKEFYEKINNSINFILESNISIIYKNNQDYTHPYIGVMDEKKDEIGHFDIVNFSFEGSKSMSIFVEDEYQHFNISRLMIVSMLYILKYNNEYKNIINNSIILSIDSDASNGFWDKIGMKKNRHYDSQNRDISYQGYEKIITLGELSRWGLGYDIFSYQGGKKRKTSKRKMSKRKTSKRKMSKKKKE